MKAEVLINAVGKTEVLKRNLVCRNVKHFFISSGSPESDVLSLNKNDYVTEFEIKVSRSDFLADKKKKIEAQKQRDEIIQEAIRWNQLKK